MKKLISVLLAVIICAAVCVPAFANMCLPWKWSEVEPRNSAAVVINKDGIEAQVDTEVGLEYELIPYGTEVIVLEYEWYEDVVDNLYFTYNGKEYYGAFEDFSGPAVVAIKEAIGIKVPLKEKLVIFFESLILPAAAKLRSFFNGLFDSKTV